MSQDTKAIVTLPANVLTSYVLPFLGVLSLKRCACVCKDWRAAVDEDIVWKDRCVTAWRGKKNVPKVILNNVGDEEPEQLYPFAIYGPSIKLTVKEMKRILVSRGVSIDKFIEKSEFQRALEHSQPRSIARWSALYTSKWKASYVYSTVRATVPRNSTNHRIAITRQELINTLWEMEFKYNHGPTSEAKFLGDGTYWSTLGPLNNTNVELKWQLVLNPDGNMFDFTSVQIGEYPALVVSRSEDWGYELHNHYVVFRQKQIFAN